MCRLRPLERRLDTGIGRFDHITVSDSFSQVESAGNLLRWRTVSEVMDGYRCINCGDPAADTYELMVRNNNHDEVPLCDECHDAIDRELSASG